MNLIQLDVKKDIKPNPYQPREKFDEDKLQELADNIKAHGLIEPIVVTKKGKKYMIVAGERRWRAMQKAGIEITYALDKTEDYETEADIKRDSLVENEIRENLTNKEFREFCESLAKSLGDPYWTKEGINPYQLSCYILGMQNACQKSDSICNTTLFRKISRLSSVEKKGVKQLKQSVDNGDISLYNAEKIASISDPQIQRQLTQLAATKDHKALQAEIKRHNIRTEYEQLLAIDKKIKDNIKPITSEEKIVLRILERLVKWEAQFNLLISILKEDERYLGKFQHENKLRIMDGMKPINKKSMKFNELMDKTLKKLSK